MAHLLERQNHYLTQNAGSKITDEIESLKAEIASTDAVAEEVAKLREIMTQTGNASDNETILNELADLREQLSSEKPSRENALILDAIARLGDEITALAEHEKRADAAALADDDLSDSLTDLKNQLNEIAGIIEPQAAETQAETASPKKQTTGAKRGRKPGSKNGTGTKSKSASSSRTSSTSKSSVKKNTSSTKKTSSSSTSASKSSTGAKRGRKPASAKPPVQEIGEVEEPVEFITSTIGETVDIDAIINNEAKKLSSNTELSLNPTSTTDAMDLADRLAKQVANKLIMEQLVEQLGDGGVSEDKIDEILRDILPQEFTTIAMTEQSDKVRRLANQLVLDKLRARLSGKSGDEE